MTGRGADPALLRLRRLAKGALFVGIAAGYVLLLSLTLVLFGWRPALLAVFFVVTGQCFRHIADGADRIGLSLAGPGSATTDEGPDPEARRYQRRMRRVFAGLTQLPNAGLAVQALLLGDGPWAAGATATLLAVELLYVFVRRLNRQTAFREASYGFRDRAPLGGRPLDTGAARGRSPADVEARLADLRAMVEDGRVSRRAYEKACDRYRIRAVMAHGGV